MPTQRPSLALSTCILQIWWGISSFNPSIHFFILFIFKYSLIFPFQIVETHASLSLLLLLSWINCGDYIVVCFLPVCVLVLLLFFLYSLRSKHPYTSFTKTLHQPSLTYIVPMLKVEGLGLFGTCNSFIFGLTPFSPCLYPWPSHPLCHVCQKWLSSMPMASESLFFSP